MTYCLTMRLRDGLVMLSDTRTNAGVDNVSTYRKLFVLHPTPDRTVVLQSAGNLATTQEVLDLVHRDCGSPIHLEVHCGSGHELTDPREITSRPGPAARRRTA